MPVDRLCSLVNANFLDKEQQERVNNAVMTALGDTSLTLQDFLNGGSLKLKDVIKARPEAPHQVEHLLQEACKLLPESEQRYPAAFYFSPSYAQFETTIEARYKNPQELCEALEQLGKPDYYPTYMIAHGMGSFVDTGQPPIVSNFDADATWQKIWSATCIKPAGEVEETVIDSI